MSRCKLSFLLLMFSTAQGYALTKQEALRILGAQVLEPSANLDHIVARMVPSPLGTGTIQPGFGGSPTIDVGAISGNAQWFVLVDLEPCALFEHDVIYVFIDDVTGVVTSFPASDWPRIDGALMGTATDLILVLPLLPRPNPVAPGSPTSEPIGDYGDAPEGQFAYFGVLGAFPTFFATTNSVLDRPGAHAITTGVEMLGVAVSTEQDVVDPVDGDGVTNIRDGDTDERMFLTWDPTTTPPTSHLIYDVTVVAGAPQIARFVNAVIDFDQSGNWSGGAAGTEWAIANQIVNVIPNTTGATQISPSFAWGDGTTVPVCVWARVALTRTEIDPSLFGTDGWDGSGQFGFGEIEDYEFFLRACPPVPPSVSDPPPEPARCLGPPDALPRPPPPPVGWDGNPVNLYALVVQGVDHPGQKAAQEAGDAMEALLNAQGFTTTRLSAGDATAGNIQAWMNGLSGTVTCQDRVLIYFVAHGRKDTPGGLIRLNGGTYTGAELAGVLGKLPACKDEPCETMDESCNVTVIMESCYSGQWLSEIAGEGRRVIVSSDSDEMSWFGRDGSGAEYSDRFAQCATDAAADADGDLDVEPDEAHNWVLSDNNLDTPKPQTPDMDDQACDCTCCGDNVRQGMEECDGTDDAACPGGCRADCTCPPLCGDCLLPNGVLCMSDTPCVGQPKDAPCTLPDGTAGVCTNDPDCPPNTCCCSCEPLVCGDCALPNGDVCMSESQCVGQPKDAPCTLSDGTAGVCTNDPECPPGTCCCNCRPPIPTLPVWGGMALAALLFAAAIVVFGKRSKEAVQ